MKEVGFEICCGVVKDEFGYKEGLKYSLYFCLVFGFFFDVDGDSLMVLIRVMTWLSLGDVVVIGYG